MPKAGYCLLVLIACSPLARGQVVGTTQPDLGANAALWYWQAFDFLPKDDSSLKILQNWDTVPLDYPLTRPSITCTVERRLLIATGVWISARAQIFSCPI